MIIILGGSGFVGTAYQHFFKANGIDFLSVARSDIDYTNTATLLQFLKERKPDLLINCAGYTGKPNVDACETDQVNCLFANAVLPGRIADACAAASVPLGHVSSGCIYTGSHPDGSGFTEEDEPNFTFRQNNCSFYSGTKALGEEILKKYENAYLWRLRIPFNQIDNPRNYLTKLMRYDKLLDATNSISQIDEFIAATFACWEKRVPFGIYNVTNPGQISTRQIIAIIDKHHLSKKVFSFFENEREFMQLAAIAPRSNCVMDGGKLTSVGIRMTPVLEAIEQCCANWGSASQKKWFG